MFIGKRNELKIIEDLYDSNQFEMLVTYGRRRIGKTTLLSKFSEYKKKKQEEIGIVGMNVFIN